MCDSICGRFFRHISCIPSRPPITIIVVIASKLAKIACLSIMDSYFISLYIHRLVCMPDYAFFLLSFEFTPPSENLITFCNPFLRSIGHKKFKKKHEKIRSKHVGIHKISGVHGFCNYLIF